MPKSKEIIGPTKSKYGKRKLNLTDMAVNALLEWRKELDNMPCVMKESKFIFPSQNGGFRSESSMMNLIHRFEKKFNIENMDVELYRFRHTFCTNLLLSGLSIPVVQHLLGDNSPDVVLKVYVHVKGYEADEVSKTFYENFNQQYIDNDLFSS